MASVVWASLRICHISTGTEPGNLIRNVIIVIGRTLDEQKRRLGEVFCRLRNPNLRINPEKCRFSKQELLYPGQRVTSKGIGTDPEEVAVIFQLEPPSSVRELKQYLAVASWY